MPIYTVHTSVFNAQHQTQKNFAAAITKLHAQTFGGDPAAVRIEYLNQHSEGIIERLGGHGFKPKKGVWSIDESTDYLVIQMSYHGSAEEWQNYCRRVMKLWTGAGGLRSIYLQRLDYEFEVHDPKEQGELVAPKTAVTSQESPLNY